MLPSRAALLASAVLVAIVAPACSLISLEGLSGRVGPRDGSTGGPDSGADAATGYPAEVLADDPLAYWRLDELTGTTAADSSGHGNDATYQGGFTLGAPGAIGGDGDTAVTLDGVSAFVSAGDRFAFAGLAQFSVEAWVSAQPQSTYAGVVSRNDAIGGPPSEGFLLFVAPADGPFGFQRLDGASVSTAVSVAGPGAPAFTHVVATFDGLELGVYVNGESQGSQTGAFSIAGAVADFVVGAEAGGTGNFLSGTIDEVAVYDHALTADRVGAHYIAGLGSP